MMPIPERVRQGVEAARLPCQPQVLGRILRMLDGDGVAPARIAELAALDPALAARILATANCEALGGRAPPLVSLEACLARLGPALAGTMLVGLAVQQVFEPPGGADGCDLTAFWSHAVLTAEIARRLARATEYASPQEAYLGGLLHDIGEIALLAGLPEAYALLLQGCPDEDALAGQEQRLLETDHAEIGAWLADAWRLDSVLADALLFHHQPAEGVRDAHALVRIVWAAHALASGWPVPEAARIEEAGRIVGLDAAALVTIRADSLRRTAELAAELKVPLAAGWDEGERAAPRATLLRPAAAPGRPVPAAQAADGRGGLADAVREIALMQPLQRALFVRDNERDILFSLWESARILTGLPQLGIFLHDAVRGVFSVARGPGADGVLGRIEVPLDPGRSLLAASCAAGQALSSFDADASVPPSPPSSLIDRQIRRALGSEGLLCVPMPASDAPAGVLVFGLSAARLAGVRPRLPWFAAFLSHAAAALALRRAAPDGGAAGDDGFRQRARRIVHEAGNPLGIIKNYLDLLGRKLPPDSTLRDDLDVLDEEIDRVGRIVRRLGEAAPAAGAEAACDLNALVRGMLRLYAESLFGGRGIAVETALQEGLAPLPTDGDGLRQVLLNLWKNAAEAMGKGGRIAVATADGVWFEGRAHVEVRIADTGPGLPRDVLSGPAWPAADRPGGLGLAVVHDIMARLGGRVICRSDARGTTFSLLLPRVAARPDAAGDGGEDSRHG